MEVDTGSTVAAIIKNRDEKLEIASVIVSSSSHAALLAQQQLGPWQQAATCHVLPWEGCQPPGAAGLPRAGGSSPACRGQRSGPALPSPRAAACVFIIVSHSLICHVYLSVFGETDS